MMFALVIAACGGDTSTTITVDPTTTDPGSEVVAVPHRVLVDGIDGGGDPWTTGLVETRSDLEALVPGADVDWESEVVFRFTLAESGSCPFDEIQGLEYSRPNLRLYPLVALVGEPEVCTDDAHPHTIVVAVARRDLPDGEFSIWVDEGEPPSGVTRGATRFAAGELEEPGAASFEPLDAAGDLAVGETRIASDVTTHCGLDRIYQEIDGRQWQLADNGSGESDYVPPEWESAIDGEQIDLVLERTERDVLVVTAVGTDTGLTYTPMDGSVGCD